ncbi:hypothetical protein [Halalkalibacter krulwichiae]|nr:hypothetical protein [Halalkalibacter krulwichiae]
MKNKEKTIANTNIAEVKRLNQQSGLTYNEAKLELAKRKGLIDK